VKIGNQRKSPTEPCKVNNQMIRNTVKKIEPPTMNSQRARFLTEKSLKWSFKALISTPICILF